MQFNVGEEETWIVGDAILDRSWLENWMFYWPNGYDASEVAETWRSVAKILASASIVVPVHGPHIHVDAELIQRLLDRFAGAPGSSECPDVAESLRNRLEQLS